MTETQEALSSDLAVSLRKRLAELRDFISVDPLSNPVRQLAHELSCQLENQELNETDLSTLIKLFSDNAFRDRAKTLQRYVELKEGEDPQARLKRAILKPAVSNSFAAFSRYWEETKDVVVFTGHPTFILSKRQREWLINGATGQGATLDDVEHYPDSPITLAAEHAAVLEAMGQASQAISLLHTDIIDIARKEFPDDWRSLRPAPVHLSTWVGYDMDGRTDIGWQDVIRHRLEEKNQRLQIYQERLGQIGQLDSSSQLKEALCELEEMQSHTREVLAYFDKRPETISAISDAANSLTAAGGKYATLDKVRTGLEYVARNGTDQAAREAIALLSDMNVFNLGMGHIHFRLNAAQIRNAARQVLKLDTDEDLFGRSALEKVQKLIRDAQSVEVNFASLAIEKSAASRLVIAMAQILKHIDAEQPIRLLIAELENPVTVLAALYLTKLFGVEDRIDICPLFETPRALDRSRRILDVLFRQEAYREYVEKRGCISIQAGFSDAGRFMGQIPAGLAIERLQGHMADLMDKNDLGHHRAIIFNTHGESMGRGNHQGSFEDRALYALSPWARAQFAKRGIPLVHENSFQGGDGYLLFGNRQLALSVVSSILEARHSAECVQRKPDPFYEDISTSLDFYRTVKSMQEKLYADQAYQTTVSAIGLAFLPVTGSRQSKRQSLQDQEDMSLRRIRAIPHNAILQQMGLLANLTGGIGQAISAEQDYFVWLEQNSDRFGRLMRLVTRARSLSEIKIFIAYMKLFDGSFWATRPLSRREPQLGQSCAVLARELSEDKRYFAALKLAAQLRSDSIALSDQLEAMQLRQSEVFMPDELDILHAIRIAILQHIFLLAARLPDLAPYAGTKKEDVLQMVFRLQTDEATALLEETFPRDSLAMEDFDMAEVANYPADMPKLNDSIRAEFIEPLRRYTKMVQQITSGISNFYSAIG
ncbi:phosphoenolpyruvate carboxylase [Parvularcula sp. IMCC14364]|uniref:phosphoenolpyruvate carboxylase n=1 Tax=Parvularcula sp. IMCC14364 TaxID=3067902 RepID=UPI002740AD89|nr:phosphoenolpyruvate carboxylase [Parvularcula sp. IMCC14364]